VVSGCLSALVRAGLVQESPKGQFRRLPVRPAVTKPEKQPEPTKHPEPTKEPVMKQADAVAVPKQTPMDILADLAAHAAVITKQIQGLTADIEGAAIAIQEQMEAGEDELKKLRQLQAILKSLG
jgi:hypothetical protein